MEPTLSVRLLEIFLGFGTRYHVSASKMISWAMRHVRAAMTTVEECQLGISDVGPKRDLHL